MVDDCNLLILGIRFFRFGFREVMVKMMIVLRVLLMIIVNKSLLYEVF